MCVAVPTELAQHIGRTVFKSAHAIIVRHVWIRELRRDTTFSKEALMDGGIFQSSPAIHLRALALIVRYFRSTIG